VTRSAAADTDGVFTLGLEIEESVKSGNAVDACQGRLRPLGYIVQRLKRQIFVGMVILHGLQNSKQGTGAADPDADDLVDERAFPAAQRFV
jgi:hypothetical protein